MIFAQFVCVIKLLVTIVRCNFKRVLDDGKVI